MEVRKVIQKGNFYCLCVLLPVTLVFLWILHQAVINIVYLTNRCTNKGNNNLTKVYDKT